MSRSGYCSIIFALIWLAFAGCGDKGKEDKVIPSAEPPRLIRDSVYISGLNRSRIIRILLPRDYDSTDIRYPVVYMLDGQNLFSDATSYAGEWHIDEGMDTLVAGGYPPVIVVGIDHGREHRLREYNPFDHERYGKQEGRDFVRFLAGELKPLMDSVYRTKPDKANTWIIGASFGGLTAMYALAAYPRTFGKVGVLSPSFNASEKIYALADSIPRDATIYISAGEKEGKSMQRDIARMKNRLLDAGFPDSGLKTEIIPNMEHNERLWTLEFRKLYRWFYQ